MSNVEALEAKCEELRARVAELEAEASRREAALPEAQPNVEIKTSSPELKWVESYDDGVYTFVGQYRLSVRPRRNGPKSHPWEHSWFITKFVVTPAGLPNNKSPVKSGYFDGSLEDAKKKVFEVFALEIEPDLED